MTSCFVVPKMGCVAGADDVDVADAGYVDDCQGEQRMRR